MVCPGGGGRGEEVSRWPWQNWARTRAQTVPMMFRPETLQELVAVVRGAEAEGKRVKAVGSSMSYSEAAVAPNVDIVVRTDLLNRVLNGLWSTPESIIPFALTVAARNRRLIHVESGIKLHALNCVLAGLDWAMPTLGGAFTQSILGAISTGTHGSDIDRPPIADSVRAIHLVGPGGKEWWIERGGARAITVPDLMESLRTAETLCDDARVVYDDDMFNAVLVSLGRMGLIYSLVIEAVPAFRLRETRDPRPWSGVAAELRSSLELEPPILQFAPAAGDPATRARFVDISLTPFFNDAGDRDCVIARRWETTGEPTTGEPTTGPPSESFFNLLCREDDIGRIVDEMMEPVRRSMVVALAIDPASAALLIPLMTTMEAIVAGTTRGADLAQAIARVSTLAAEVGQSSIVRDLVSMMIRQMREPFPNGFIIDDGFKIMTGQQDCPDERLEPICMRQIDAMEFAFDAGAGQVGYLDFIDGVSAVIMDLLARNRPAGAGLSLRFMQRSEALLAMQRFAMTCTVEIFSLRGLPGSSEFLRRVQTLARDMNAIPHWGLMHDLNEAQVSRLYGENHTMWRRVLQRLIEEGGGRPQTFSTTFSVRRGLEPLPGCTVPLLAGIVAVLRRRRR